MKTLLLSLLALTAAAVVAEVAAIETFADETVPELQEDKQLPEDNVPVAEEDDVMFAAAEMEAPDRDRTFTCPSAWVKFESSCYLYVHSAKSWSNAEAHCDRQGASLASVHGGTEYNFRQSLTTEAGSVSAWMGGLYFQGWRWVNQGRFFYQNWSPLIYPSGNPCIYLQTHTVGWTNGECGTLRPSICMRRIGSC
ncbi:ladderlectin-like [Notolabrus celidotus]|uniref:ladderlectin-like n=1 Tax=Notolabrus celidotus TaxID=1203425 RepID=UPI0014906432|nr:ladderlectin-like [Notolabrus celidotus]